MTTLLKPNFSPSELQRKVCRSWCERLVVEDIGSAYAVLLPLTWPTGEPFRCYVEVWPNGRTVMSDWGGIRAELFAHGIHNSDTVDSLAAALGLQSDGSGAFVATGDDLDMAQAAMSMTQLAAAATADLLHGEFQPPAVSAWSRLSAPFGAEAPCTPFLRRIRS
jgi:hypothetical protein